jgi:hypothetical protein
MTVINARRLQAVYLQLVRSNFGYASQVWCPQSIKLIEDIEKVQRRATKYILNLGFTTNVSYITRLHQLELLPITYWHEYLDMVLLNHYYLKHHRISLFYSHSTSLYIGKSVGFTYRTGYTLTLNDIEEVVS